MTDVATRAVEEAPLVAVTYTVEVRIPPVGETRGVDVVRAVVRAVEVVRAVVRAVVVGTLPGRGAHFLLLQT